MLNREAHFQGQAPPNEVNRVAEDEASRQAMQRAEELVDQFAERVGYYTGVLGHQLLRLVARAREEAEDIWAEAQNLRRGQQS